MKHLAALLALATLALVSATTTTAAATQSHFAFDLLKFTPTGYVDSPPQRGMSHPSAGDIFTATSAIYDSTGKHRLGRTSELCTVTMPQPLTMDCSLGLIFANGSELLVRGAFNPTSTPWRASIVGGYGTYAGASGWVRETDLRNGERMTGVLLAP